MKLLLVGMDGVEKSTFQRGWTPFISSLIEQGCQIKLKEDLISRGWAEVILGEHASVSKAVYEGPLANGTHDWSEKYKLADTPSLGDKVKPIWQVLNDQGYKVGIMNVPTTFPSPKVNGFFVSGGGGGGPVGQDVGIEQCYPPTIQNYLSSSGYILDERLTSLLHEKKLYNPDDFYGRLKLKNQKRTDTFIALSKQYDIDFGFLVYKSSMITAETLVIPELAHAEKTGKKSKFIDATQNFYVHFDLEIKRLIEAFPDTQIILISDHSMKLREWTVNANAFLVSIGLQTGSKSKSSLYSFIKSYKHLVPMFVKKLLKSNAKIKTSYESMTTFDKATTKAFSIAFSHGQHGIFINDRRRFNGPVDENEIEQLKKTIIDAFNCHPDSIKHQFRATKAPQGAIDQYPDIVLDLPDGYLTASTSSDFVTSFKQSVEGLDLRRTDHLSHNTIKGHSPLALNVNGEWLINPTDQKHDLRLIYDHVLTFFNK